MSRIEKLEAEYLQAVEKREEIDRALANAQETLQRSYATWEEAKNEVYRLKGTPFRGDGLLASQSKKCEDLRRLLTGKCIRFRFLGAWQVGLIETNGPAHARVRFESTSRNITERHWDDVHEDDRELLRCFDGREKK